MYKSTFKILLIYISIIINQIPENYSLEQLNEYSNYRIKTEDEGGLPSQSIIDFRLISSNDIIVGTSGGLGVIDSEYRYLTVDRNNLPIGGNPALEQVFDSGNEMSIIVTSGVESIDYDLDGTYEASGTGISWSLDNGESWNFINQPLDDAPDCENVSNVDENTWFPGSTSFIEGEPDGVPDACYPKVTGCSWDYNNDECYYNPGNDIIFEWNNTILAAEPNTTKAKNVTYDVSIDDVNEYIYAASWAGMLRRFKYTDDNPTWEHVALPTDDMESMECGINATYPDSYVYNPIDPPSGYHNHKAFSVLVNSYNGETYIWAGTANGVNRGKLENDGCISWEHFTVDDDDLAGDWVIDIVPQYIEGNDTPRIWLISWTINGPGPHGLTYSDNNGNSWITIDQFSEQYTDLNGNEIYDIQDEFLDCDPNDPEHCEDDYDWNSSDGNGLYDGAIVYNLYFNDDIYYAATNRGLYWSKEDNINIWTKVDIPDFILEELNYIENIDEGIFFEEKIYSCIARDEYFYIGTPNGLIIVSNVDNLNVSVDENLWSTYIASEQSIVNENKLNIFPNPFKVGRTSSSSFVTFEYKSNTNGEVTIFDFSMNKVDSFDCKEDNYISENIKCTWDGYNSNRIKVANGVYFCKMKTRDSEAWGKLMVINLSGGDYE